MPTKLANAGMMVVIKAYNSCLSVMIWATISSSGLYLNLFLRPPCQLGELPTTLAVTPLFTYVNQSLCCL